MNRKGKNQEKDNLQDGRKSWLQIKRRLLFWIQKNTKSKVLGNEIIKIGLQILAKNSKMKDIKYCSILLLIKNDIIPQ